MLLIGISVSDDAPLEVRDRLAVGPAQLLEAVQALRGYAPEALIVSAWGQTDFYVIAPTAEAGYGAISAFIEHHCGISVADIREHLTRREQTDAARRLFAVASGADGAAWAEVDATAVAREAFFTSEQAGASGPMLALLGREALRCASEARAVASVKRSATSVGKLVAAQVETVIDDLPEAVALTLGIGSAGQTMAQVLRATAITRVTVAETTTAKATVLARSMGAHPISVDEAPGALAHADVVIAGPDTPGLALSAKQVRAAIRRRSTRPMLLLDLAVPRAIDPDVRQIEGAHLYDIDDVRGWVRAAPGTKAARQTEDSAVAAVIESALIAFSRYWCAIEAGPTIRDIRHKLEAVRREEMDKAFAGMPALSETNRARVEAMTFTLANRLTLDATSAIKEGASIGLIQAARSLFGLPLDAALLDAETEEATP